jgi:hypothetical protein
VKCALCKGAGDMRQGDDDQLAATTMEIPRPGAKGYSPDDCRNCINCRSLSRLARRRGGRFWEVGDMVAVLEAWEAAA